MQGKERNTVIIKSRNNYDRCWLFNSYKNPYRYL